MVDTETLPLIGLGGEQRHQLRFGWACYQRTRTGRQWTRPEWFRFETATDFWSWVEARARGKVRMYLFAHNWAFDAPVLDTFNLLPHRKWVLKRAIIECPPVILVWRREETTIEMLDTLNWWLVPLAEVGRSMGIPKLEMPATNASRSEWDTYARRDVEIVRVALLKWWDTLIRHDLGGFARTKAGQAMRSYRHRFMDAPILIDEDLPALKLARESYHGGRVEAFRIGRVEGPVHCYDVNSMYPFVMRECQYPVSLARRIRRASPVDLQRWAESYCLVARVRVHTQRNRFSLVRDGKLIFPIGRFWIALTTPDLNDALESGEIEAVDEVCLYERAPLFSRFVSELYTLRLEAADSGDTARAHLLKYVMNSLYGKFGQKGSVWETIGPSEDDRVRVWREHDVVEGTTRLLRQFAGIAQEKKQDEESRESHPAIAAHVTAYARAHLWGLIKRVDPGCVLYCDTDSLIVTNGGRECLANSLDEVALGGLKHEWSAPWIEIHGAKDYRTESKTVIKGVRAKAQW
ncbi:MAG: hypothetical protein GY906_09680, partial [bacterium]|nr:hypothetical protein [bacterium]